MIEQFIPHIVTAVISLIGAYFTLVQNLKTRVTVLEQRIKDIESDMGKQDEKLDKLADILSKMQADIASIKTALNVRHE